MRIDIREKIKDSFLYKRFAYRQSEGFISLMKFLERENLEIGRASCRERV